MRLVAIAVLAACYTAPPVRVPAQRIGPLAEGLHEFRRGKILFIYDVQGHGPSCMTSDPAPSEHEREHTVVYFGSNQKRRGAGHRATVRDHVGLPLPDCDDLEATKPEPPPRPDRSWDAMIDQAMRHPVKITVRDYQDQLLKGAKVRAGSQEGVTDVIGRVVLDVPRGTRVTATQSDMYGYAVVDGDHLEIAMMQLPM